MDRPRFRKLTTTAALCALVMMPGKTFAVDLSLRTFLDRASKMIGRNDQSIHCGEEAEIKRQALLAELERIGAEATLAAETAIANLSAGRDLVVQAFAEQADALQKRIRGQEPIEELAPAAQKWGKLKNEMKAAIPTFTDASARDRILSDLQRVQVTIDEARHTVNATYDACK